MATTNYPHPFLATLDTQLTTALPQLFMVPRSFTDGAYYFIVGPVVKGR